MARISGATTKANSSRPKRAAAQVPVEVPTSIAPAKRGRPAKGDAAEDVEAPPKKRGRPTKLEATAEEVEVRETPRRSGRSARVSNANPIEVADEIKDKAPKKRGRPAKSNATPVVEEAPKKRGRAAKVAEDNQEPAQEVVEKKRAGRPRKDDVPATPKKTAAPRAAGTRRSPRRLSMQQPTPASIIRSSRPSSRLRTRVPLAPPKQQTHITVPAKRRGRPAKAAVKPKALAPQSKKGPGRKSTARSLTAPAKVTKTVAPRKRRGYTTIEVPDKFVGQMKEYLESLVNSGGEEADDAEDLVPADGEGAIEVQGGSSSSDVGEEEGALSDQEQQEEEATGESIPNGRLAREVSMGYDGLIDQSTADPDPADDADVEDAAAIVTIADDIESDGDVPATHLEVTDIHVHTTGGASPSSDENVESSVTAQHLPDGDNAYVHLLTKSQTVQIRETNEEGETRTSVLQVEEELNLDDLEQPSEMASSLQPALEGNGLLDDVPLPAGMAMSG